ncbi:MAG: sugar phosphate nucleotidyltransferase, partial [Rhodothermales bacterium]
LYSMDYRKMFAHHQTSGADVTIATVPVSAADASGFGILKTDEKGIITEFHEKPAQNELAGKESPVSADLEQEGRIYLASMGIYIFNNETMRALLDEHPEEHDFGRELIPRAIDNLRVVSYPFTDYWSDIGTIGSFYEANIMLASQLPAFDIYSPNMPLYTNARMLPPAKVLDSHISESLIGEASVIQNSRIEKSVIGIRSFVANNVTIRRSVILGADYYPWHDPERRDPVAGPPHPGIENDSVVEGTIVDRNVSIGKRCVIRNVDNVSEGERDLFYIRDGIIVIPKNYVIPDDTVL